MSGWICLYRDITDHWIWKDSKKLKAWIDLVLLANHEYKKFMINGFLIECNRGDLAYSQLHLAERWKWSRQNVRTFLELLKKDGMITVKSNHQTTIISICNYNKYQDYQPTNQPTGNQRVTNDQPTGNQRVTNDQPTGNQRVTTNNNENNYNNENKETNNSLSSDRENSTKEPKAKFVLPDFVNPVAWEEFEQHRKEIKKSMSDLARTKAANQLNGLTFEQQQEVIDYSIQGKYPGLYPDRFKQKSPSDGSGQNRGNSSNNGGNYTARTNGYVSKQQQRQNIGAEIFGSAERSYTKRAGNGASGHAVCEDAGDLLDALDGQFHVINAPKNGEI